MRFHSIKDALQDYILTHSTRTRDQWKAILPDVFRRTEFTILPMWDQYAIPNRTVEAGIYSSIANLQHALAFIKQVATGYPEAHINANAAVVAHPYKALQFLVVGSADNRDDLFELVDVFPDYIPVASTSLDFNRMSQNTQSWALLLMSMLLEAEHMGEYTSVPVGMTRLHRGGRLFLVKSFGNINYLVAAKKNFEAP